MQRLGAQAPQAGGLGLNAGSAAWANYTASQASLQRQDGVVPTSLSYHEDK